MFAILNKRELIFYIMRGKSVLKRKVRIVAGVFCSALLLTGCGKVRKMSSFKESAIKTHKNLGFGISLCQLVT